MDRDAQRLRAMDVCETGRIGNDGVGNERNRGDGIRLDTRRPAAMQHLLHHLALLLDVAGAEALHARDQGRVAHHVCHQLGGIATDGEELEAGSSHKRGEYIMGGQSYAMAVLLELVAQRDERLYVAAATDDLYDNVELDVELLFCWRSIRQVLRSGFRDGIFVVVIFERGLRLSPSEGQVLDY